MQLEHQNDTYDIMHSIIEVGRNLFNKVLLLVGTAFVFDKYVDSVLPMNILSMVTFTGVIAFIIAASKALTIVGTCIYTFIKVFKSVETDVIPVIKRLKRRKK